MKIFLDLDGVLVNWSGGLCKLLNIDPYDPKAQEILRKDYMIQGWKFGTTEEVNEAVNNAGYDFWMNLELLPWAQELLNLCKKYGPVYFLTSPGPFHAGAHAKLDYIWEHFGSTNYILTSHKYVCSVDSHILIDDMKKNIDEWNRGSGLSFHWPCQWELRENPELLQQTLQVLEDLLLKESSKELVSRCCR